MRNVAQADLPSNAHAPATRACVCRVCGAATFIAPTSGVYHVTIEHDDACDFLRAVDTGRARLFCEANGYPIEVVTLDAMGVA